MPRQSEEYRAALDAALRRDVCGAVFGIIARCRSDELGVEVFSMQAVARKVGVATGTLYNYFGSKDELIACVVEESLKDYRRKEAQIAEAEMPAVAKLRALCEAILDVPVEARKVLYVLSINRQAMPAVMKVFAEMNQHNDKALSRIIRQGQDEGVLEDIAPERLMLKFSAIVDTFVDNGLHWGSECPARELAATIVSLFMNGAAAHRK